MNLLWAMPDAKFIFRPWILLALFRRCLFAVDTGALAVLTITLRFYFDPLATVRRIFLVVG